MTPLQILRHRRYAYLSGELQPGELHSIIIPENGVCEPLQQAKRKLHTPIAAECQVWTLTLILPRSRTGTVWFYTSTSNKRAA